MTSEAHRSFACATSNAARTPIPTTTVPTPAILFKWVIIIMGVTIRITGMCIIIIEAIMHRLTTLTMVSAAYAPNGGHGLPLPLLENVPP